MSADDSPPAHLAQPAQLDMQHVNGSAPVDGADGADDDHDTDHAVKRIDSSLPDVTMKKRVDEVLYSEVTLPSPASML